MPRMGITVLFRHHGPDELPRPVRLFLFFCPAHDSEDHIAFENASRNAAFRRIPYEVPFPCAEEKGRSKDIGEDSGRIMGQGQSFVPLTAVFRVLPALTGSGIIVREIDFCGLPVRADFGQILRS